jgi:hypothetical protein
MKTLKSIFFAAALTVGAFAATFVTSCTKDACKDITCLNGGNCTDGTCTCPLGYEGTTCATMSKTKYLGSYKGDGFNSDGNTYTNWTIRIVDADPTSTKDIKVELLNGSNVMQTSYDGTITPTGVITCTDKTIGNFAYKVIKGSCTGTVANLYYDEVSLATPPLPTFKYTFANFIK